MSGKAIDSHESKNTEFCEPQNKTPRLSPSELQTEVSEENGDISIPEDANEMNFQFSPEPTLEDIRQIQDAFCKERNWDQFHMPRNLLLAMVGEVGEVSEIFQWRGEVKEGLPDWSEKDKRHLSQELSDVLIYLVRLADKCHIDLPAAALSKIALNKQKYPAEQVYGSSKKYNEYKEKDKNKDS